MAIADCRIATGISIGVLGQLSIHVLGLRNFSTKVTRSLLYLFTGVNMGLFS